MPVVKPILRIFDYAKAQEFYMHWLGFRVDWVYEQEGLPVYLQVSMGDIVLHLSEHHGDASPGARVFIDDYTNLRAYHQQLIDKDYKYNRPGIYVPFWDEGALEMTVHDPFGNRLTFVERGVQK
jgi:catechol 2,3-dioxygenase-like lactoylglutathione lyase family enzyme